MKPNSPHPSRGLTLLEMTIVIMMLMALVGTGLFSYRKVGEWRLGREASETVRQVYTAQRLFLADNPARTVASINASDVVPYLPGGGTSLPTVRSLTGQNLTIRVNVSPPVINGPGGTIYDPSGNPRDSLWDVGE